LTNVNAVNAPKLMNEVDVATVEEDCASPIAPPNAM